jgi:hypothetical protein
LRVSFSEKKFKKKKIINQFLSLKRKINFY